MLPAHEQMGGNLIRGDGFGEVTLDIKRDVPDKLRCVMAVTDCLNLLRVIQDHVVVELCDLMNIRYHFTLLNVRVAGLQGVLHIHAAPDGGSAGIADPAARRAAPVPTEP